MSAAKQDAVAVLRRFVDYYPHGVNPDLDAVYCDARDVLKHAAAPDEVQPAQQPKAQPTTKVVPESVDKTPRPYHGPFAPAGMKQPAPAADAEPSIAEMRERMHA
jgi:hypothetical protein